MVSAQRGMENEKVAPVPSLRAAQMSTITARFAVHSWRMRHLPANVYETLVLPPAHSVNALPVMNASLPGLRP